MGIFIHPPLMDRARVYIHTAIEAHCNTGLYTGIETHCNRGLRGCTVELSIHEHRQGSFVGV